MAADEKWYFTKEQLLNSPSRKSGYDVDKELSCRQQAANFIQDMGQRLQVSQLCINTAIVYMHRFYVFHSLASFHRNAIAAAALFLAAKVEEQPRKLEHVIKVAHMCLHRDNPSLDTKSEQYLEQAQDLVFNENVLLQTLGFDVAIDHPHTHVVRCCHLVRASKDLAQTSYFMASNSLHLTTMCLQYKPTVVACFCIHLACKWSNWEIPKSNEGKEWFWYVDKTVTLDLLEQLTTEFLAIFDKCPTKLKRKMMSMNQNNAPGYTQQAMPNDGCQFEEPRKLSGAEANKPPEGLFPIQKSNSQSSSEKTNSLSSYPPPHTHHQKIDYREYREKKERERERMEREKQQQPQQPQQQIREGHNNIPSSSHHHSKTNAVSSKSHPNVQSRSSSSVAAHKNYQQPHIMQQNMHYQNVKENRESSAQNFQSSSSVKDSNYLKQHPPHTERENKDYLGQYPQNANVQHQNYSHKPESSYPPNYPHREGSRASHGNQYPAPHHGQPQSMSSNNPNIVSSQREFLLGNQRENLLSKDNSESQPQAKDAISSSIRDIISQTVSSKDLHSKQEQMAREKLRLAHMHSNSSSNYRPETLKNGREHVSKNYHESRMVDSKSRKPEDEETVIQNNRNEPIPQIKTERLDETDATDEFNAWNAVNLKTERKDLLVTVKTEPGLVIKVESNPEQTEQKLEMQAVHMKAFDPKYKSHYHSNSKTVDTSHLKTDRSGVPSTNDLHKKITDRIHEKQKMKPEFERSSYGVEGNVSAHHKSGKELAEKHKLVLPGQSHAEQRSRDRSSPSKLQKIKSVPRPSSLTFIKGSESVHFGLPESNVNAENNERPEKPHPAPLKLTGLEESKNLGNLPSYPKQQKNHEFGAPGSLASTLPDTNVHKTSKSSSIFSPDSKIPPQNILSSLEKIEKDSKKVVSSAHKTHSSSKVPPSSTPSSTKKTVPVPVAVAVPVPVTVNTTMTTSTTSTTGSLFSPPLPKQLPVSVQRHRTSSSSSEPELIPVLTKLEETPGYENIIRERKIALTPVDDKKSEKLESVFDFDHKREMKSETPSKAERNCSGSRPTNELRSDIGAVIYPANQKPVAVPRSGQGFTLTEPKLSLTNSNVDAGKQSSTFAALQPNKPNISSNFNLPSSSVNAFALISSQSTESSEKLSEESSSKNVSNQEIIDVEGLGHSDGHKKSEKKKKKEKHKHKEKDKDKDKDRSERKKEKKKHKEKDKERSKDKEKHKDKERHKDKDKHKEKEIDVVGSEAPKLKITIPKEKLSCGLKIKIKKELIDSEPKTSTSDELKIKIRKDVLGSYKDEPKSSSKKRERSPKSSADVPHSKSAKTEKSSGSSHKSNGTEGSSRNSSSHKHSVSENDSYIDISSLYDFPFDFEENGQGVIKTPDYDFEALNASEAPVDVNTSPENNENENSHNEATTTETETVVPTGEKQGDDRDVPCDFVPKLPKPISPLKDDDIISEYNPIEKSSPVKQCHSVTENVVQVAEKSLEDCDVLKNYKTILDSHSKRHEEHEIRKHSVSPVSPEETILENSTLDETDVKDEPKLAKTYETENPNYYNKYFNKRDGNTRARPRDEKRIVRRAEDKIRYYDDRRYYDSGRHRNEYSDRDRRDDRRYYRDYARDYPRDYYDRKDDRRYDYATNQYFTDKQNESTGLNYDINENATSYIPPGENPQLMNNPADVNLQYQYGYYSNYVYPDNGYRYFGNVPYVNISLMQQQPVPPGTGDPSVISVPSGPPPLPLEPPPDLPPPPETPPPK